GKSGCLGQWLYPGNLSYTTSICLATIANGQTLIGSPVELCKQSPGELLRCVKTLQAANSDWSGVRALYHIQTPEIAFWFVRLPGLESRKSRLRSPIPTTCFLLPFYLHFRCSSNRRGLAIDLLLHSSKNIGFSG
ncbi:MAG: hypothetical protein JSW47_01995, partial [Phycisphaerales bacterium]